ncbi:MAG: S8 family serine peptidase, partial [Bacteroidia bacterium]
KSTFSNYGTWIDISAPGSSIRSTVPSTGYSSKSGTSMASPLVAGLCGLMLSANPLMSPAEVLECLQLTADNINSQNGNYIGQLGGGRINAEAALECASASALAFDASVLSIISPSGSSCNTNLQPIVQIRNTGQSTISSLAFTIQLDTQSPINFTWSGTLASQQSQNITLPQISGIIGNHTLTICSSTINGNQADGFEANNCRTVTFSIVSPIGNSLPFTETFESGNFSANGWTISNPDNGLGWEVITSTGTTPGNKSARIPFYSYSAIGQRDGLITPTLNFSAYTEISLSFDHAYRRYAAGSSDSLIVSISTDCGETYPTRILVGGENGQGTFATASISTTDFIPGSSDDWCNGPIGSDCIEIDLNAFSGSTGVRVKFEGFNNYGNNLYLDNINIDGTIAGAAAIADFTVAGSATVCQGGQVLYTNLSGNQPSSYTWTFPGGTPSSSSQTSPTITYNSPGVYQVSLMASNAFGADTEVKTEYITIEPTPALSIAANPSIICKGTPTTLTGFGASVYEWSPVIAISSTAGEIITANPPQTTTYTLMGTSAAGCEASVDFTLVVNELPDQPTIEVTGGILISSEALTYQWYLNNESIAGANSQNFEPAENGSYKVEITDANGCSRFSNSITFENEVSIAEIGKSGIKLYPNPAKNFVTVEGMSSFEYSIFQSNGQLVSTGFSENGNVKLGGLALGLYFIRITNDKYSIVERLIISNQD